MSVEFGHVYNVAWEADVTISAEVPAVLQKGDLISLLQGHMVHLPELDGHVGEKLRCDKNMVSLSTSKVSKVGRYM